jgi:RNA recognition motif-containing protein
MPKNQRGRGGRRNSTPYNRNDGSSRPNELYVTNLSDFVTKEHLLKGFQEAGPVSFCVVLKGGRGLVAYEKKADAQWALKNYNQTRFHKKMVAVKWHQGEAPKKGAKGKDDKKVKGKGKGKGKGKNKDGKKEEKKVAPTEESLNDEMDSYWNKVPEKHKANLDSELDDYFKAKPDEEAAAEAAPAEAAPAEATPAESAEATPVAVEPATTE